MKVRIPVVGDMETFVGDVLLWGMETDIDVEHYKYHKGNQDRPMRVTHAVFSIETDNLFMFMLRWGADKHKKKP